MSWSEWSVAGSVSLSVNLYVKMRTQRHFTHINVDVSADVVQTVKCVGRREDEVHWLGVLHIQREHPRVLQGEETFFLHLIFEMLSHIRTKVTTDIL